jgi:transglutaminase-like putative cysteine protease
MNASPTPAHLAATAAIDSDHPAVQAFARQHAVGADDRERAVSLALAVRDGFRYDPYKADLSPQGMRASTVLANGYGWCVPKAVLLAAVCRAAGIPARLGFADVCNHLSTARMRQSMETQVFYLARLHRHLDRRRLAQGHARLQPEPVREVRPEAAGLRRPQ